MEYGKTVAFFFKALHNWVDPQSTVSWRVIEADKVKPNRLQDILFTGTGKKGDNYKFGPVVANSIKIWKMVERRIGGPFKFCNSTHLWHSFNFVCGNRPFVQPSWSSLGVNTCGDIYDNQGLCSFQTLRTKFCLPASAYFVFLQLRSALKAYGVPWASSISSHPMRDWIAPSAGRPSVSLIYNKIIDCITKHLSIKTIWNRELSDLNLSVDWERVWSNKHRIDFKILLITYKALNGLAPQYLSELLSHYSPSRPLRSQNSGHLIIPRISKSTAGGRSFSYLAPKLWNNLPNTVREADTLCQFKSRLKTHLFNLAYT